MNIESMKIDGIEYDVVSTECRYKCDVCDIYDFGEEKCQLEKGSPDFICPLANQKLRSVLKRKESEVK
jgi:hypothetical protein